MSVTFRLLSALVLLCGCSESGGGPALDAAAGVDADAEVVLSPAPAEAFRTDGPTEADQQDCRYPDEVSGEDEAAGISYRLLRCNVTELPAGASSRYEVGYFELTARGETVALGRNAPFVYESTHHNWADRLAVRVEDRVLRWRFAVEYGDPTSVWPTGRAWFVAIDSVDGAPILPETEVDRNVRQGERYRDVYCGDSCRDTCGGWQSCNVKCGNDCRPECTEPSRCDFTVGASSEVVCAGGSCEVTCEGDCSVACHAGARCTLHCAAGASCTLSDCASDPVQCDDGTQACGTVCPPVRE